MSLFEDGNYLYRDTFFIHFQAKNRPSAADVQNCLATIDEKYEIEGLKETNGMFESITIRSPHDSSAMDITFVQGEEVTEQVAELLVEFQSISLTGDDMTKLKQLKDCDCRFDIFHFERQSNLPDAEDMLDPGGLLLVMGRLADVCSGVALDPQSKTLL